VEEGAADFVDWMTPLDATRTLGINGMQYSQLLGHGQLQKATNTQGKHGVSRTSVQALLDSGQCPHGGRGNPLSVRGLKRAGKKIVELTVEGLLGH